MKGGSHKRRPLPGDDTRAKTPKFQRHHTGCRRETESYLCCELVGLLVQSQQAKATQTSPSFHHSPCPRTPLVGITPVGLRVHAEVFFSRLHVRGFFAGSLN